VRWRKIELTSFYAIHNFCNENLIIVLYDIRVPHEYYKANIGLVFKCVHQRVAIVPTMSSPAHIKMWTGLFFPAAAKSTLPVIVRGLIYYGLQAAIFRASRLLEGLNDMGGGGL
jgi:hypothetical protein